MKAWQKIAAACGVVTVLVVMAFAAFVWPTRYRYEHAGSSQRLVRIDRITGGVEYLSDKGWVTARPTGGTLEPCTDEHRRRAAAGDRYATAFCVDTMGSPAPIR